VLLGIVLATFRGEQLLDVDLTISHVVAFLALVKVLPFASVKVAYVLVVGLQNPLVVLLQVDREPLRSCEILEVESSCTPPLAASIRTSRGQREQSQEAQGTHRLQDQPEE